MKSLNITSNQYFKTLIIALIVIKSLSVYAGQYSVTDSIQVEKENYLATSVFILSSLIPDDNTYFFELDYGRKISNKLDAITGMNIYKYTAPMSTPINDKTKYPGTVTSYGAVFAIQYYYWKNLYIDQMINPLILDYNISQNSTNSEGFMLLLATRMGYNYDFNLCNNPFFIEVGVEISYWPLNSNVPSEFGVIDEMYKKFVFSPAFQFGFKF